MHYMKIFMEDFELKGVGIPEYDLGGDVEFLDEHWTKENIGMAFSSKTYISNLIPKFEKLFNMNFESDVFVHLTVIACGHKIENIVKVSTLLAIIANIWQKNVKFSKICENSWFSFDLYLNQPLPGS